MSLAHVSTRQALEVYAELVAALMGEASHGDTAEVYAYRLLPYMPLGVVGGLKSSCSEVRVETMRRVADAADALVHLCGMMEKRHRVWTFIDGLPPEEWRQRRTGTFTHRVHVQVRQRGSGAEPDAAGPYVSVATRDTCQPCGCPEQGKGCADCNWTGLRTPSAGEEGGG